ncbi:hypothetical protein TNIN_452781, partial [Trichonephila inaurata madagascariensis]
MNTDQTQDMDLANSSSLPSSRTSSPVLTDCDRLQIAQDEIKKFSILLSNVSHTINAIESCVQEDDPELTHLYSRQEYLYERRQAAVSEFSSLPRCTTPGCQIHNCNNNNPTLNFSPVNSPSKKSIEFPELPKINRPKRKESEDGFTSPTYRQTFKKANLEIKNFTVDTSNKFKNLSQNNASDTTGNPQPIATQNMPNTSNNTTAKTTPNTLPPPVFLNIDKNYLEQLKTLTKTIPTLRSKKTGELIRLYTNNFEDYRLLNNTLEKLKFQYFCIKPKQERPIKVVIKGLPRDTETQHIHENLIELGYTVDK